jgi:hypothetical protein
VRPGGTAGFGTFIESGGTEVNAGVTDGINIGSGGVLINAGTLIADESSAVITIANGAIISGAITANVLDGLVDVQGASRENVHFLSGGTGGLQLDAANTYRGTVVDFGSENNARVAQRQFIDITSIDITNVLSGPALNYVPNSGDSGVLKVTSGGQTVASINMIGHYTTANFTSATNPEGHLFIVDPLVVRQKPGNASATIAADTVLEINVRDAGKVTFANPTGTLWLDQPSTFTGTVAGFGAQDHIDLPSMAFGPQTTLGYTENSTNAGGTLTINDGAHTASIALLGNYIAGSFVTAADGHGGTLVSEAAHTAQQPLLTKPHA